MNRAQAFRPLPLTLAALNLAALTLLPAAAAFAQQGPTAVHNRAPHATLIASDNSATAAVAAAGSSTGNVTVTKAASAPMGDFTSTMPNEHSVRLTVGRSAFLSTRHRLTRVYVTNPAVLDSYTASANQVVLTAKSIGVSSVILWDEAGEQQDFLVTSGTDVDLLRESLAKALPNEHIAVKEYEGRLMLTGTVESDAISDSIFKLASSFGKDVSNALVVNPSQAKQVELKVRVIEVDRNKIAQFAINLFNGGGNKILQSTTQQFNSTPNVVQGGASCGSNQSSGCKTVSVSDALNFFLFSSKLNLGATIQDLETMQLAQILAEPSISAISGQKAQFLAGGEFPFPIVSNAGGVAQVSIQFRPYGVKLEFTPVVNVDGTIDLKVAPEVSALDYTNAVTISGYTIPALSTRKAETRVVLNSGESFAIAGLLDQRTTDQFAKTPGIANVPVLGELFKSKNTSHSRTELIVIVTPTIVEPLKVPVAVPAPMPVLSAPAPLTQPVLPVKVMDQKDFDNLIPKVRKP